MPRKTKTTKKRPQKKKYYSSVGSMERTMETGIKTIGNVAVASMGIGLAGAVLGGMGK